MSWVQPLRAFYATIGLCGHIVAVQPLETHLACDLGVTSALSCTQQLKHSDTTTGYIYTYEHVYINSIHINIHTHVYLYTTAYT